jgi:hypothetical protein
VGDRVAAGIIKDGGGRMKDEVEGVLGVGFWVLV